MHSKLNKMLVLSPKIRAIRDATEISEGKATASAGNSKGLRVNTDSEGLRAPREESCCADPKHG